jgi:hypothetical protein
MIPKGLRGTALLSMSMMMQKWKAAAQLILLDIISFHGIMKTPVTLGFVVGNLSSG